MRKSFDTSGPIAVEVDIAAGSVHLIAGDQAETGVTVNPADASSEIDLAAVERARVEFSGSRLSVLVPKPAGFIGSMRFRRFGLLEVTIELPEGSSANVKTGAGDVRADGVFGEVTVKSGAGDIRVDRASARRLVSGFGRLSLLSSTGDAELQSTGDMEIGTIDGSARVKNLNGETRIEEVTGSIEVQSSNGNIVVNRAHSDVAVRTANGNVDIGELVSGSISLATAMGGIDIGIAAGTAAWVDAATKFGRVDNVLEPAAGPEGSLERVEIRARTSFGDVSIHRSST